MPKDLTDALSGIGAKGTAGINNIYSQAKTRRAGELGTLGMAPGSDSYSAERFPTAQGISQGNLEAALGGELGNTGYQNALQEREFNQNKQLAEEAAALNKPSLLQQIFQGIGSVGKPVATYAGLGGFSGSPSYSSSMGTPNYSGYFDTSIPNFGYGQTYPNMMRIGGY